MIIVGLAGLKKQVRAAVKFTRAGAKNLPDPIRVELTKAGVFIRNERSRTATFDYGESEEGAEHMWVNPQYLLSCLEAIDSDEIGIAVTERWLVIKGLDQPEWANCVMHVRPIMVCE